MSQVEHGVRKILAKPAIYNMMQWLMGASKIRTEFVRDYVKPSRGDSILDIGCGTADILCFLPDDINYFGFDQSDVYIEHARDRFADRGQFSTAFVDDIALKSLPKMDIVLASGLIHHLDDDNVKTLLVTALHALRPGGRLVAIDPCYVRGQSTIARWLIDRDRGNNVRSQDSYKALAEAVFTNNTIESRVSHRNWIPYTHHILVCEKK